jgi:hypothetical protein
MRADELREERLMLAEQRHDLTAMSHLVREEAQRIKRDLVVWSVGFAERKRRNFEEAAELLKRPVTPN